MTQTDADGNEIILEPGDEGYVDPNAPPAEPPVPEPATAAPAPAGKDLVPERGAHEHEAEYLARTRGEAVRSESPTDIVPNQPQITMTQEVPIAPPEAEDAAPEPAPEAPAEEPSA